MSELQKAVQRVQMASDMSQVYFKQPLTVCYSGGRDSEVLVEIAKISKVPFIIQHSHTTIDAPPTVKHIRKQFAKWENEGYKCKIDYPPQSFWQLLGRKTTPPTRLIRYCCEEQKEFANKNKVLLTGVRWDESSKRKNNRGIYESNAVKKENRIILMNDNDDRQQLTNRCMQLNLTTVNPIIDWSDKLRDDFITDLKLECNPLYCMGFKRCGCVGCPMASKQQRYFEFEMFPKYKALYMKGFQRMLDYRNYREKQGLSHYKMQFKTANDIWLFFMEENTQIFGQYTMKELWGEVI